MAIGKILINTPYKVKAVFWFLVATLLLAMLIGVSPYAPSFISTGFTAPNNQVMAVFTHLSHGASLEFGYACYVLPIVFFIWSTRYFFSKRLTFVKGRSIALMLSLLLSTTLLDMSMPKEGGGFVGSWLSHGIATQTYTLWVLLGLTIVSFVFATGATFKELLFSANTFAYLGIVLVNALFFLLSKAGKVILYLLYKLTNRTKNAKRSSGDRLMEAFAHIKDPASADDYRVTASQGKELYWNEASSTENTSAASSKSSWGKKFLSLLFKRNPKSNQDEEDSNLDDEFANYRSSVGPNDASEDTYLVQEEPFYSNPSADSYAKTDCLPPAAPKEPNTSTPSETMLQLKGGYFKSSIRNYHIPLNLLHAHPAEGYTNKNAIKQTALKLERIIKEFGIEARAVGYKTGPVVTLFEISIPPGIKTAKIINLEADIALRMKAFSVRIAVVMGKDVIGIEIPNATRQTVYLRKLLEHNEFKHSKATLPINLGLDIGGQPVVADLATMPHLLVAGTTGSGKSVSVNAMILSLLYKHSPAECKMIMIDPKMLELSIYQDIPHLLTPVVTDPKKAVYALKWAVKQMEHRYSLMSYLGVRNIKGYNKKIKDTEFIHQIQERLLEKYGYETQFNFMPYIVVIIDEMADLMLVAGKEIEAAVQRLAQMARAAGIHLIMATQRPSVDVITGTIKANFPTRISFQVSSRIDSTTILGDKGAEQLLGRGDMLYMMGVGRLLRVHGPFVSDAEVEKVVETVKRYGRPNYIQDVTTEEENDSEETINEQDELYPQVIELIKQEQKISTSYIQRKFQIGYNRAARIVEQLEHNGIVSKASPTGKREILI